MPGRRRTGSSPSKTSIDCAVYPLSPGVPSEPWLTAAALACAALLLAPARGVAPASEGLRAALPPKRSSDIAILFVKALLIRVAVLSHGSTGEGNGKETGEPQCPRGSVI